ncbi:hypothetical protein DYB28_005431 [Aphanomyces astaci]|uniref:Uncharacterized protein n=1 Tax=Aphanomyces astaci TaxID=112090 RepID=A0A397E5S4_APHAT|nr:hypothetical protein AaE_006458 [Aphanomyces astaci]RHY07271.1 hypothetical protein DYB36_002930 [Aphanomyces astaci]RHY36417.1 hypothetical protein DYB25_000644 [Aphanomyces astaci]RHY55315.1 hypothetical protein DYB38_003712 [Aphanomyces astaci]RHY66641.1 hypothetical protein DYB34_003791 [Aphanomyces astaci]
MVQSTHGLPLSTRPSLTSTMSSSSLGSLPSMLSSFSLPSIHNIRTPPPLAAPSVAAAATVYQSPTALSLGSLKARKKMIKNTVQKPPRRHNRLSSSVSGNPLDGADEERQVDGIVYQSRVKVPQAWNFTNAKERWQAAVARTTDDQIPRHHRQSRM